MLEERGGLGLEKNYHQANIQLLCRHGQPIDAKIGGYEMEDRKVATWPPNNFPETLLHYKVKFTGSQGV